MARRLPGRPTVIVKNTPGPRVVALNTVVAQPAGSDLPSWHEAGGHFDPLYYRNARALYYPEKFDLRRRNREHGFELAREEGRVVPTLWQECRSGYHGSIQQHSSTMWAVILGTEILHWNVKWVFGYPGTNDLRLALARGEIDMTTTSDLDQIRTATGTGNFVTFFQTGTQRPGNSCRARSSAERLCLPTSSGTKSPIR